MALLHPEKVGIYVEPQGDRMKLDSTPGIILEAIDAIRFRWYYTYANAADFDISNGFDNRGTLTDPGYTPNIVQYPSIWDPFPRYQNSATLSQAQTLGRLLLTYNEPWNPFNGYWPGHPFTPTQALDGWPTLQALGNRLASPSIGPGFEPWLAEFMAGAASRGYRVDAINVHFYSDSGSIANFQNYLQSVHNTYPTLPIIVSEWAMAIFDNVSSPFSPEQQADWAEAGCQMMDGLSYVEAHAWFAATEGTGFFWQHSAPINADGTQTAVGNRFASLLSGTVITPPPPTPQNYRDVRGTKAGTPGSYFEVVFNTLTSGGTSSGIGVANLSQSLTVGRPGDPNAVMYYANGYAEWPGSGSTHTWASYGVGDVIGVFYKSLTVEFYKNGTLAGIASVEPSGSLYPLLSFANANDAATANFGSTDMNFLPAGATSWDGSLTSGGRHVTVSQTLAPIQQITGSVSGAAATLNPSDKSSNLILSNDNLTVASSSGGGTVRGTKPGAPDRYFELSFANLNPSDSGVGVGLANLTQSLAGYPGDPNGVGYFNSGYAEWPGSGFDDIFQNYFTGAVIGVYLRTSTVEFYKNGTLVGTATTLPSGALYPAITVNNPATVTANFGATTFTFLPSGATAWNASGAQTGGVVQTLGALGQVATATVAGGTAGVTLNPADKFTDIVLSNANLRATYTTSRPPGNVNVRGNTAGGPDNYFEIVFSSLVIDASGMSGIGVANLTQSQTLYPSDPNGVGWFGNGYAEWPGSGYSNNFGTFGVGDVLGVFRRATSVEFYKNGTLVGTASALPAGALYPIISFYNNTDVATVNFGASAFAFAPSGALPWGT